MYFIGPIYGEIPVPQNPVLTALQVKYMGFYKSSSGPVWRVNLCYPNGSVYSLHVPSGCISGSPFNLGTQKTEWGVYINVYLTEAQSRLEKQQNRRQRLVPSSYDEDSPSLKNNQGKMWN